MGLKICMSVLIGEYDILTKFRANPMHLVHVVHVHECARRQFWAIILSYEAENKSKNWCLEKLHNSNQTLRVS